MDRNLSMFDYLKLVMRQSNITIPERVAKGKGKGKDEGKGKGKDEGKGKGKSKQKHRGCFDVMEF
jgi:hypothetical protein